MFTSGEHPRVHKSGHAEVGEGEEEDHGIIDGNDRGEILWQPRAPGEHKKKVGTKLHFDMLLPKQLTISWPVEDKWRSRL